MIGLGPWPLRIGAAALALAVLGTLYLAVERRGYERAMARCEAQQAEIERANRQAIENANRRLERLAKSLTEKSTELDHALSELDRAAAAGPGATDLCLDAVGARRLQSIGQGAD
ncbi:hypothetical protein [Pelagibacterium montanilacus]|uniref:hypothetical protein n=1 Tax=Pelagibacterium montanilacus TaxID=2185280 RepID=UPI000F8F3DDE|nr:hypothetical protein [Pelagibacterium montanilacus]